MQEIVETFLFCCSVNVTRLSIAFRCMIGVMTTWNCLLVMKGFGTEPVVFDLGLDDGASQSPEFIC